MGDSLVGGVFCVGCYFGSVFIYLVRWLLRVFFGG